MFIFPSNLVAAVRVSDVTSIDGGSSQRGGREASQRVPHPHTPGVLSLASKWLLLRLLPLQRGVRVGISRPGLGFSLSGLAAATRHDITQFALRVAMLHKIECRIRPY